MLPAPLRYDLRHDPEFFSRARSVRSGFWTVLYAPAVDLDEEKNASDVSPAPLRFAIIVKKSVAGGVERSQIKRKTRQAITDALRGTLPSFLAPYAVVIIPRRKALGAPARDLAEDLTKQLLQMR